MRKLGIVVATILAASIPVAFAGPPGQPNTFTVDCNRDQTISDAIARGDARNPLVVNVRGTCQEFVTITRANVTLRGDPSAEIVAPNQQGDLITVSGDRVTLENLTLTGGLTGLSQDHAPTFIAQNVVIQDTSGVGVRVRVGDARLIGCTVQRSGGIGIDVMRGGSVLLSQGSQVLDSAQAGIRATRHGLVSLNSSSVMRSGAQGIVLSQGSQASITNGSTIAENAGHGVDVAMSQADVTGNSTIRDNGGFGIGGHGSPITIDENTITGNQGDGVMGYIGTTLVLHGNVISGNNGSGVVCMGNCLAQIGRATIAGNGSNGITLNWGAKLILEEPATAVSGNGNYALWCGDSESSFLALAPLNTSDPVDCTDFNH